MGGEASEVSAAARFCASLKGFRVHEYRQLSPRFWQGLGFYEGRTRLQTLSDSLLKQGCWTPVKTL